MSLNLEKLVSSYSIYDKNIVQILQTLEQENDLEATLKKIILFCKYSLSTSYTQRKKYLCLKLIKDIAQWKDTPHPNKKILTLQCFEKMIDENIPNKLMKVISWELSNRNRSDRSEDDYIEYVYKMMSLAVETVSFWGKKLAQSSGKSQFAEAYDTLKKLDITLPKTYEYYKVYQLTCGLFEREEAYEYTRNEQMSPILLELYDYFMSCKTQIYSRVSYVLLNDYYLFLKTIHECLHSFLLHFHQQYKQLYTEESLDRDVLVVYFHIANTLYQRLSNRLYIQAHEMIAIAKEVFEGDYNSQFSSIDRMDIIHLAGVHRYNAANIFHRIQAKIESEERKMPSLELLLGDLIGQFTTKELSLLPPVKSTKLYIAVRYDNLAATVP